MAQILFVDDERDILSALQRAVEIFGHQALLTTSGEQAVRIAQEKVPDLIFIDMRLFDMAGTEVISCKDKRLHPSYHSIGIK
jgi:CheY-like chemotaxis protein